MGISVKWKKSPVGIVVQKSLNTIIKGIRGIEVNAQNAR